MNLTALSTLAAHWPTDWIFIGAFAALVALDCLRSGNSRACALALALPVADFLLSKLPTAFFVGNLTASPSSATMHAVIAGVVIVALFVVTYKMFDVFMGSTGPISALLSGVALAAVVVVFWLEIPSLSALWTFGPQVQAVFAEQYRVWWLLVSYAALAFARG